MSCLTTSGFFLWFLGYPDRAAERAERAIARRDRPRPSLPLAYAYYHAGFLHLWRREPDVVAERAESSLRVAETSDLPLWRALATVLLGAATSAQGRPEEGIRRMADGLDQYQGLRTPPVFWPLIRWMQAGAHVDAGTPGARLSADRRGPRDRRQRHAPRPPVPHHPRRPVAARPRCGPGRGDSLLRARLRCVGESRRPDDPAPSGCPACPAGPRGGPGASGGGAPSGPRDLHGRS